MQKIKCSPNCLFSVDKTGTTVVQHKASRERGALVTVVTCMGALVTVVTCMGASGIFLPSLLIFPMKNMKLELDRNQPLPRHNCSMPPLRADTTRNFH
jgi:hypothetical protein